MMHLSEAARILQAQASAKTHFDSVGTDSRYVEPGSLFVALRGERFDGHDFVAGALAQGAAAAMVERAWADRHADADMPLLVVPDTRRALGELAAAWRRRFDIPVIGVTGSNGKTTVKEMCAAVMRAQASADSASENAVLATSGNLNNDIGLPLTLLALRSWHRSAVVEMGMNHPGEIAYLAALAQPTVSIVTNAQRAHLQGMGTLIEVAREKGAIYTACAEDGTLVINADDPHADYWREQNQGRHVVTFGIEQPAAVSASYELHATGVAVELTAPQGCISVSLQVPGVHNVRNALGAATACLAAGAGLESVAEGLRNFTGTPGRLQRRRGRNGSLIIDDSYNANPDSVRAAIDVLAARPGRKLLVLGDMGEIGRSSAQVHDEVGGYAKSKGVDALYALGQMSAVAARNFGEGGRHFDALETLLAALEPQLDEGVTVLVKGSRSMRMERVVEALGLTVKTDGGADAA